MRDSASLLNYDKSWSECVRERFWFESSDHQFLFLETLTNRLVKCSKISPLMLIAELLESYELEARIA